MREIMEKNMSGYMTVEASLVMTVTLMVYLFLIRCMLYQYDRCIWEQKTAETAVAYADVDQDSLADANRLIEMRWDQGAFLLQPQRAPGLSLKGSCLTVGPLEEGEPESGRCYRIWLREPENLLRIQRRINEIRKQGEEKK